MNAIKRVKAKPKSHYNMILQTFGDNVNTVEIGHEYNMKGGLVLKKNIN